MNKALLALGAVLALGVTPAVSQEAGFLGGIQFDKNADKYEVRLGGGAYDAGPFTPESFDGGVVNGEFLFPSFDVLKPIGSPRPYIGTDIAISDDPIHVLYAGLNWQAYLTQRFYLGFSLGGSVNTDSKRTNDEGSERDLGSNILFHLQATAGVDITEKLGAEVFLNHISNANLGPSNDGLESTGVRLTWKF
ncbi:acyloxyacyl hydrolase [Tianweitania sp. BSSL-BM11]|uniref:Acyloxyacyl hydrolase n=1 Tax=Tianweitania aestuarii TaxID=2814886 RepID=A0ABS5RU55_9HYPH|nr:acyloxyacyl hydrolase [Tianweitania aestuarii]MBS9719262.1 acyloxyacyl hydrolase [Tianweitania aestuarii]